LKRAKEEVFDYFSGLGDYELPQYVLTSDFQYFELFDLDEGTKARFALRDLPNHVEKLGFIAGIQKRAFPTL